MRIVIQYQHMTFEQLVITRSIIANIIYTIVLSLNAMKLKYHENIAEP
jgi:hypothetical protein